MTAAFRIPGAGRVDHSKPVPFTFDGQTVEGRAGDTVASALLANGIHLMGRSFKYHRPRGVVTAGSEEPNAVVGTSRGPGRFEPNTRAHYDLEMLWGDATRIPWERTEAPRRPRSAKTDA